MKNKKDDEGEYFTDEDWLDEAVYSLKSSFRIARIIDDPMGQIKALRGLSDIARRRGHRRMAVGWRRWADKTRRRRQQRRSPMIRSSVNTITQSIDYSFQQCPYRLSLMP